MKKVVVFCALVSSTSAFAEWVLISFSDLGRYYMSSDIPVPTGQIRNAWLLTDYMESQKIMDNQTFRSVKSLHRVNCVSSMIQDVRFVYYNRSMGEGSVIESIEMLSNDWEYIVPDSVGSALFKVTCNN